MTIDKAKIIEEANRAAMEAWDRLCRFLARTEPVFGDQDLSVRLLYRLDDGLDSIRQCGPTLDLLSSLATDIVLLCAVKRQEVMEEISQVVEQWDLQNREPDPESGPASSQPESETGDQQKPTLAKRLGSLDRQWLDLMKPDPGQKPPAPQFDIIPGAPLNVEALRARGVMVGSPAEAPPLEALAPGEGPVDEPTTSISIYEIAKAWGVPPDTARWRLRNCGVKPLKYDKAKRLALYLLARYGDDACCHHGPIRPKPLPVDRAPVACVWGGTPESCECRRRAA